MAAVFCVVTGASVPTSARGADTVLVLKGLGHQTYFPADALLQTMKLTLKDSYLAKIQTGMVLDQPFPKKLEGLKGVQVIVLADVPVSALNGLMGRRTLRQFVEHGGGLLVFGGPFSFGKGEATGCAFEPAMPVTTQGPWDLVKTNGAVAKVAKVSPITNGLKWDEKPVLHYCHKTAPKPGAEILLECDGIPLLVLGQYGKGRVAVFTGAYLGAPAEGEVFFYQWRDYAPLLSRIIQWLSTQSPSA